MKYIYTTATYVAHFGENCWNPCIRKRRQFVIFVNVTCQVQKNN